MPLNVLLCYPEFPHETFWSFDRALALSGRRATMPPLGLLTVAAMMPREEFEVRLADANLEPISDEQLLGADVVFASAMLAQRDSLTELVERCKSLDVPIVVGGPMISGCYRELRAEGLEPTCWFIGEAEAHLPQLLADLLADELKSVYAHVVTHADAAGVNEVFDPEVELLVGERPTLDSSPLPRFELLEVDHYHSMAIQASRGCPIGCDFCDIWKQFGLKSRTGSPERITAQLDALFSLGWRGRVFVVDDNFIGNVGAARGLLPALEEWQVSRKSWAVSEEARASLSARRLATMRRKFRKDRKRPYPFAFSTEADVRLGSDAPKLNWIRQSMARAGFNSVFLGIETPSAEALQEANKGVNVGRDGDTLQHLLDSVRRIQEVGLQVMSGFIVGFDHDPEDIQTAMVSFIERAGIPMAMVGLLSVVPGTELHERLVAEGRYRGRLHGDQTHETHLDFIPRGLSERAVFDRYAHILKSLYGPRMGSYYERCESMLAALPGPPRTGDGFGLRELRALVRSLVMIRPRRAYWSFLLRTLWRRPRFTGLAVVLAIQGDHLHHLTERWLREYEARTPSRLEQPSRVEDGQVVGASSVGSAW